MIANARMYSITPKVAALWRALLDGVAKRSGVPVAVVDHLPPTPISELWQRPDKAAVFMCGLPYSLAAPRPSLIAAPVPSPTAYGDRACYWTDFVVRADSRFERLEQTFGERIAFTTTESQSGFGAPLHALMDAGGRKPLYRQVIEPRLTPMGAITAVTEGLAEIAPLDSYALALLQQHAPELTSRIRVIASTEPTAVPALVGSQPAPVLSAAFLDAHQVPELKPVMDQLLLRRFTSPDEKGYDVLRARFDTVKAFWSRHNLAETTHPAFAAWFGTAARKTLNIGPSGPED
jgi:ABC-type phosphate/phosphonate transport system substrate-binding protein